jgi:hypothetical protein
MAERDDFAIVTTFNLICIKVFGEFSNWRPSELPFHGANTCTAEESNYAAVAIVLLITELV